MYVRDLVELIGNTIIIVPVSAFIVLAAVIAVIMSLERILGQPIPNLRNSLPVRRNRAFCLVLFSMAISFVLVLLKILEQPMCYDCAQDNRWKSPLAIVESSIIAMAFSGALGWIVYAALWVTSQGWRMLSRYVSPAQNL
jgi:hypothetical protein